MKFALFYSVFRRPKITRYAGAGRASKNGDGDNVSVGLTSTHTGSLLIFRLYDFVN